jgi:hypothetical protein
MMTASELNAALGVVTQPEAVTVVSQPMNGTQPNCDNLLTCNLTFDCSWATD